MELDSVPQEGNATLDGHRKVVYARDSSGRMVMAASRGWEAEEIVTTHAIESLQSQTAEALARVRAGEASPLAYWMCERRMDVALLAQTSGYWQWRVKRHLRPEVFARLSAAQLSRYAQALGLPLSTLKTCP